jgi:two-component system sensor histidine kinase/response regulator
MLLYSGALLIIMAIIVILSFLAFYLNKQNSELQKIESNVLKVSQLRHELLVRRDSMFSNTYQKNYNNIKNKLFIIDSLSRNLGNKKYLEQFHRIHQLYSSAIMNYVKQIEMLGLNENQGIEGIMRDKIHNIENILKAHNLYLTHIHLLQVRRREKDFIMRTRVEYLDSVNNEMNRLINEINKSNIQKNQKEEVRLLAKGYLSNLKKYSNVINELSILEKDMFVLEKQYVNITGELLAIRTKEINDFQSGLVIVFIIAIITGILLAVFTAKSITKPLKYFENSMKEISNGNLEARVNINTNDELSELAKFFNKMMDTLNESNQTIISQQDKLTKQYEDLKNMNITKDKFFSIIAHDLKNPISSFVKISDFLVEQFHDLSKDEIKEFMDEVQLSANSVYELLENLLLWSRTQRGLVQFHPMNLDLRTIILNNINLLKMNADTKKINLNYSIESEITIYADPNMINTILRNLITNAIKFTHENGIITVKSYTYDDEFCAISVEDNGIGIPEDKRTKMFNLESSYSTSGTNNEKGTGLGLILCKEFVEKHNGKIWVESTKEIGSTFIFTVPLKSCNQQLQN